MTYKPKRDQPVSLPAANLAGRAYEWDKPKDCRYCFWYECGRCERDSCYFLLPVKEKKPISFEPGNCDTCAYGKHFPCIGYCIAKLMLEQKGIE